MYRQLSEKTVVFQKDEIIIRQGEPTKYLYFLKSGSCYRSMITDKGDNIIYEIKEADNSINSLLGVLTIYSCSKESNFTFTARNTCHCIEIASEDFQKYVLKNPDFLQKLMTFSMEKYKDLREVFQFHQEGRIPNLLCRILLSCCQTVDGKLIITKKYSLNEMSSLLGVHQVTVSRIIRSLCEENVIKRIPNGFLVMDYQKLYSYANKEEQLFYK